MPTANLPENLAATYPAQTYTVAQVETARVSHLGHTDTVHRIINRAACLLRWDASTRQWETRPAGMPYGVTAISTNDATAVPPHTQSQTGFVSGDVWEWHTNGGPAA